MGLGGLLRLELFEAVECLGESESCSPKKEKKSKRRHQRAKAEDGIRDHA